MDEICTHNRDDKNICDNCCYSNNISLAKGDIPSEEELYDLADIFRVFGDTTRIKILWLLFESEKCVCDIAQTLSMGQSAVSHQLRLLRNSHLVRSRREGKQIFYSLDDEHVRIIFDKGLAHVKERRTTI